MRGMDNPFTKARRALARFFPPPDQHLDHQELPGPWNTPMVMGGATLPQPYRPDIPHQQWPITPGRRIDAGRPDDA